MDVMESLEIWWELNTPQVVFHGEACVPGFASTIVAAKKRLSGTVLYLGRQSSLPVKQNPPFLD